MTYAAFYIPEEQKAQVVAEQTIVSKLTGQLRSGFNKTNLPKLKFDLKNIARNMNIQGTSEFVQRYAVGALTKILNNEPVTNQTMLDSLFNTYAPALNLALAKTEYNSLMQMKEAVMAGNVNPAYFLEGFSSGLEAITDSMNNANLGSKYGKEIPIDVVESLSYEYKNQVPEQKTEDGSSIQYVTHFDPVEINLIAHIKNKNAELWEVNDTMQLLGKAMADSQPITFRVGKSVYENCYISTMNPKITNIHEIKLDIRLKYDYDKEQMSQFNRFDKRYRTLNPGNKQSIRNHLASEVYLGTIVVS